MSFFIEKNLNRYFLPSLNDVKSKTNQNCENQTYITKKQTEFQKIYDISKEKKNFDLEIPEYITVSPTKRRRNDDDNDEHEIPDLDEDEVKNEEYDEKDVDLDDPDWENLEEEEDNKDDEEFEKPKKRRSHFHFPRATAAAIRLGISTYALCILIWAYNMGKKICL